MEENMTVRKIFDEELSELKLQLVKMCRVTEEMMADSITALTQRDYELAQSVVYLDKKVDEYEMNIEKQCLRLLIKQQPVARDFRTVSSALKIITDVERIGDQAADISALTSSFKEEKNFDCPDLIPKMGELAIKMVKEAINSFVNENPFAADDVIKADDEMDDMFDEFKRQTVEKIKQNSQCADTAILFMMIAKYLERIGDHAVNICEWTKYNESGVHVKV